MSGIQMMLLGGNKVAISFIASAQNSANASTTIAINKPTGTVTGSLMIAFLRHANSVTFTPPAGWTEILDNGFGTAAYYRVAQAGEGSSYTFTASGSGDVGGIILSYANAAYDTIGSTNVATNPVCPSITLSSPNSVVIACSANDSSSTTFTLSTWTSRATLNDQVGMAMFDKSFAASGATGTVTITTSNSSSVGFLIGIMPA